jgi:hypothetical protein
MANMWMKNSLQIKTVLYEIGAITTKLIVKVGKITNGKD